MSKITDRDLSILSDYMDTLLSDVLIIVTEDEAIDLMYIKKELRKKSSIKEELKSEGLIKAGLIEENIRGKLKEPFPWEDLFDDSFYIAHNNEELLEKILEFKEDNLSMTVFIMEKYGQETN